MDGSWAVCARARSPDPSFLLYTSTFPTTRHPDPNPDADTLKWKIWGFTGIFFLASSIGSFQVRARHRWLVRAIPFDLCHCILTTPTHSQLATDWLWHLGISVRSSMHHALNLLRIPQGYREAAPHDPRRDGGCDRGESEVNFLTSISVESSRAPPPPPPPPLGPSLSSAPAIW